MIENVLIKLLPSIDLHGEDVLTATILAKDFINDNYKMGKKKVVIIHGHGTGALKKGIHDMLKKNKLVSYYQIHIFNSGMTIVNIKSE